MILFELLHGICPQLPIITAQEFITFKQALLPLITTAKRGSKIPDTQKTVEEIQLAPLLPTMEQLIAYESDRPQLHLCELLLDDDFNQNQTMQLVNSQIWKIIFLNYILTTPSPGHLVFAKNYDTLFFHPTQFAGLLTALLEKSQTVAGLFETGIMQKFFKFHVNHIETIEDTYQLIAKQAKHHPLLQSFLSMASVTPCGMNVFAKTNIMGTELVLDEQVELIAYEEIEATSALSATEFKSLFSWFRSDFLIMFLSQNEQQLCEQYLNLLTPWFAEQSTLDIRALYQNIFYLIPQNTSYTIFKAIGKLLPVQVVKELVTMPSKWFWIALATSTRGTIPIPKKHILELAYQHPIEIKDIDYVHDLCHKPQFKPLYEHFYQQIFQLFVQNNELDLKPSVFHYLRLFPKTKQWAHELALSFKTDLLKTIKDNLDDFNSDKFINIRDLYLSRTQTFNKLKLFNTEMIDYPDDHYELTSLVLAQLYHQSPVPQGLDWAKSMLPGRLQYNDTDQEALDITKRILREWVSKSTSFEMMMYACLLLKQHFELSFTELEYLLPMAISINQLALYNNVCFDYYLQLFPHETLANVLTQSPTPDGLPMVYSMLENPRTFLKIMKKLSGEECYQLLSFEYKHELPIFVQLFDQTKILSLCLSMITSEQRQALFKINHQHDDNNIFYLAIKFPKTLQLILSHCDYQDLIQGIQAPNLIQECAFELSFETVESFSYLVNRLEIDDLYHLCQNMSKHSSKPFLESILQETELLDIVLHHLPEDAIFNLLTSHRGLFIECCAHKPPQLSIILGRLSGELSFKLLASTHEHHTLMHHICKYPVSMHTVLTQVPAHMRLELVKLPNHKQQSVIASLSKPIYPFLSIIIEILPAEDLMDFASLIYHQPRTILDLLMSNIHLFQKFYLHLPKEQQKNFLFFIPNGQERVIDQISLHETHIIKEICSILPEDTVYQLISTNQAHLLQRALPHPETLEYFLKFVDKIELPELLFPVQENFSQGLFKLTQTESVVQLMQAALSIDHQNILMHKHQSSGSILQLCFNDPNALVLILDQCSPDTLEWISQKIILNAVSCKPLIEKPSLLSKTLQLIPEPKRKSCLEAMCQQNPSYPLSSKLKSVFTEVLFPNPKMLSFFQPHSNNNHIHVKLKQCTILSDILGIGRGAKKQTDKLGMMRA